MHFHLSNCLCLSVCCPPVRWSVYREKRVYVFALDIDCYILILYVVRTVHCRCRLYTAEQQLMGIGNRRMAHYRLHTNATVFNRYVCLLWKVDVWLLWWMYSNRANNMHVDALNFFSFVQVMREDMHYNYIQTHTRTYTNTRPGTRSSVEMKRKKIYTDEHTVLWMKKLEKRSSNNIFSRGIWDTMATGCIFQLNAFEINDSVLISLYLLNVSARAITHHLLHTMFAFIYSV